MATGCGGEEPAKEPVAPIRDERESGVSMLEHLNDPEYITLVADEINEVDLGDMLQITKQENRTTEYRWYFAVSYEHIGN